MAESIVAEEIGSNTSTGGDLFSRQLYSQIIRSIQTAVSIDIIVAFLMESGINLLKQELKSAVDRGVKVRILTGNYLGITQPVALQIIKREFGQNVDLRFYNDKGRSFHPKAYFFHYEKFSEVYVGSSNISYSAMKNGIEWNYKLNSNLDGAAFKEFYSTFEDLFYNHSIIIDDNVLAEYKKSWRRPAVQKDIEKIETDNNNEFIMPTVFQPRGPQTEALYALQDSRAEGATKALIHAATGIGKTYLAAFDSRNYKKILFVAHKEEILIQAAESFKNVRATNDIGFFNGKQKDTKNSLIFASVNTLGKKDYLNQKYFSRDNFDYIVIDEFHHAVNDAYKNIIEYFNPKFLLGLTATPDRMDGKNIYQLCDYNVPYELSLKDAINQGVLVPFHYYGIFDDTDYSHIKFHLGHYDEESLNVAYINNYKRSILIFKQYKKYKSVSALGFCASKKHAEYMAKFFSENGVPSLAVYSGADGEYSENRKTAIELLKVKKINVIFSVDMFNEGLDIPDVDMVLFLRPTESPVVFLQQLGRGLRKSKEKSYLNVLDFIGNYAMASKLPSLLNGEGKSFSKNNQVEYPEDCIVDFDLNLIDLFEKMDKKKILLKEKIIGEYKRIKEFLQKVPTRIEMFTYMDEEIYEQMLNNSKENILKYYLDFLNDMQDLSGEEKEIYNSVAREFLNIISTTSMTKVYKMPVLLSFVSDDELKTEVGDEELLNEWKNFFDKNSNWKDLGGNFKTFEEYKSLSDKYHLSNIIKNPVNFLIKSGGEFFIRNEKSSIALSSSIYPFIKNKILVEHYKDIIEYRTMDYYRRRYRKADENREVEYRFDSFENLMVASYTDL